MNNNKPFKYLNKKPKTQTVTMLLNALNNVTIKVNTGRLNSGKGRTQVFGKGYRRNLGYGEFANNKKYPEVYKYAKRLGKEMGFKFDAIQINHNYEATPHIDKNNIGDSMIISIGNYDGGELVIDDYEINTRNPIIFNGSEHKHYVKKIKSGDKYSFVYFKTR